MRIPMLALLALMLPLAGCSDNAGVPWWTADRDAREACAAFYIQQGVAPEDAHSACLHEQYRQQATRTAAQDEDAATMLLLGGTAFLNGWNTRYQRPTITCITAGILTQCN